MLWVAVLGFIVFYLYALISFAMLRSSFDPENNLYCASLWQCTITIIRYGLIGDMFDVSNCTVHSRTSLLGCFFLAFLSRYFQILTRVTFLKLGYIKGSVFLSQLTCIYQYFIIIIVCFAQGSKTKTR